MPDHLFVETLIITATFVTVAAILVLSVWLLERSG